MARALPPSASVAQAREGTKLHAPSAARNVDALCEMLHRHAPTKGNALEIASGTGQHITEFARALPDLYWQPTEIDADRRASIDAYIADAALKNVASAKLLNATAQGWGQKFEPQNLITLANLIHLISTPETRNLINETAQAIAPGGTLILYGPFRREGFFTSEGDTRFDAELRAADPAIGYKDTLDIASWLGDAGLTHIATDKMPANNLAFIARKPNP